MGLVLVTDDGDSLVKNKALGGHAPFYSVLGNLSPGSGFIFYFLIFFFFSPSYLPLIIDYDYFSSFFGGFLEFLFIFPPTHKTL